MFYGDQRVRGVVGALLIFAIPLVVGAAIYERYWINRPTSAPLLLIAILGAVWLLLVIAAYRAGGDDRSQNS